MKYFKYTFYLSFHDERNTDISYKAFPFNQQFIVSFGCALKICDMAGLLPNNDLTGQPFTNSHMRTSGRWDIKSHSWKIGKALQIGMIKPNAHSIHIEVTE